LSILFNSTEPKFSPKNIRKRKDWINKCISEEGFSVDSISFIFCSDNYLLEINQAFLKHDYFTDVITFSETVNKTLKGEIYISIDRVKDNASSFNVQFDDELNRVLIHGVLHLMNFQDSTKRQKSIMTAKENSLLAKF
jgi:probable rRNA maturation factor